jgi:hypothetical protein
MALNAKRTQNILAESRPGLFDDDEPQEPVKESPGRKNYKGLLLSDIQLKPLSWFRYNPDNQIFRDLKTSEYFHSLEKDIVKANAIITPLIATPDGLLIEGESRHIICQKLFESGSEHFGKLPTRIVLSPMTRAQIKERLFLGNLSRFDIPREVKILAYAEIWPKYFLKTTDGSRGSEVTTKKEIAAATGLSESQIKRDKAVIKKAAKIAEQEKAPLSLKHIKSAARQEKTEKSGKAAAVQKDKNKYDLKHFHAVFKNRDSGYFDFSIKLVEELHRNSFMSNANVIIVKALIANIKNRQLKTAGK